MYNRLLVPLDGSRLAEAVLPLVERLAGEDGTVALLHVMERRPPAEIHGERHLTTVADAHTYLDVIAKRLRASGPTVEQHEHDAPEGDVARSIVEHAEEIRADLIVLCTHGTGGLRGLLFGSIAQRVLRRGSKPVLLARPTPDGHIPPFEPKRVLVPLDSTAASEVALVPAADLARYLRATLHLVVVVPTQETLQGDRIAAATLLPSATRTALDLEQDETAGYLEQLASRLRSDDLSVTTEVRRGETAAALASEAAEPGVGLVVVATHGRAGLQAIWANSVTAQLLSHTLAPVLLLRRIET